MVFVILQTIALPTELPRRDPHSIGDSWRGSRAKWPHGLDHHVAPRRTQSEAGPEVSGPTLTLVRASNETNAVSRQTGILRAYECAQQQAVLRKRTAAAPTSRVNGKGTHGTRPVRVQRSSQRAAVEEGMDDALMTLYDRRAISAEEAYARAEQKPQMRQHISGNS